MKIHLSLALAAAVAMAVAASPADAASKKKSSKSSKAAKVVVTAPAPYWASSATACFNGAATWWFPFAAIGSVGCGIVYAIPVAAEGFLVPQGGKA
jgi:hypothetical protein